MCTDLKGKASWFLPFNKGWNDGAGNPPNPNGLKTDYLWREVLTRDGLTDIIENYAQVVEEKDERGRRKSPKQIFPRYHQLDAVRKLLADVAARGVGRRYLIQHSAGSGKSNSIAWLAHQLIEVKNNDGRPMFDTIIVVTDRRILDKQIQTTIKQFTQVKSVLGAVTGDYTSKTNQFSEFLDSGKKIVVTTIQTFPFVLDKIGGEHRGKRFAILIDEAHSSQGGKASTAMNAALGDPEDTINEELERRAQSRKMLGNASYFAFTATPKSKTLEIFGEPVGGSAETQAVGVQQTEQGARKPFHTYTMKQAIQEGFILDVLENYTPVNSFYELVKTIDDDPEFDTKKAQRKLRRYVERHDHAIRVKAEIMVDHFHDQVIVRRKVGGQARAMVICNGIDLAIAYYQTISAYLEERKSPYRALVAFSGEKEHNGTNVTEASLNGFPSKQIAAKFCEDPHRFLVVADKFQTGYDEPLLHTMYVDKPLSGIKAVQTLSRLNRAHPDKRDTFVLDFMNDADTIESAFSTDLAKGILEAVDMESYRAEMQATLQINPDDEDGNIEPSPTGVGGHKPEAELDRLSSILKTFNDQWGTQFTDADKVARDILDYLIPKVAQNAAYQNAMKHADKEAARLEHDEAVKQAVVNMLSNNTELYKLFSDNLSFRQWLTTSSFAATYQPSA